jgi:dephospho-CoA kinase
VRKKYRLIGLTGTNGAGKGEVAAYLVARGYTFRSLSEVLRGRLAAQGRPPSRDNLIAKGNELRKAFGPDILAGLVLETIHGPTVIDSIRTPAEVARLRTQKGFVLLAVDAPPEVRFARVRARGRDESAETLQQFLRKEKEEMTADPEAQQIHSCLELADLTVVNDGSIEALHKKLEAIL